MAGLKTIGRIYDALADAESEKFLGSPDIVSAAFTYQRIIEKHIPERSMDNAVAAISQYGIACNKAGFEEGFRIAWKIIEEMRSGM